jgi:hypothetical protein
MNREELHVYRARLCDALYRASQHPDTQILIDTNPDCCGRLANLMPLGGFSYDQEARTFVITYPELHGESVFSELKMLHDMVQGGHLRIIGITSFAGEVPKLISDLFWKNDGEWAKRLIEHANPERTHEDQESIATEFLYEYTKMVFPDSYIKQVQEPVQRT